MRSLARTALISLSFALVGCGHTQKAADEPQNAADEPQKNDEPTGPRLLPWQLQAAGTTPLQVGIWDSLRGVHCRFLPDTAGQLRCLPTAPPALAPAPQFADAGCTERVYRAEHLDELASVVGRAVALPLAENNCEQRYVVGKLREFALSEPHFGGIPGSCRQYTPLTPEPGTHDFVVAEVTSPSAWVSGKEVDGALLGDRLRLREFAADGEQSFSARLVDEQWNKTCSLDEVSEKLVCLAPMLRLSSQYFVDAECRGEPLWRAEACSDAVYIGRPDEVYVLGEAWQGPVFAMNKVCEKLADSEAAKGDDFFQQGEPVGLDALPGAEWTTDGSERLRLRGLKADDGSFTALSDELFDASSEERPAGAIRGPRFLDAEAGEGCAPLWTRDAGVRCVPESTVVDPPTLFVYADPDCDKLAYFCATSTCPEELVLMDYDENGEHRAVSRNRVTPLTDMIYMRSGDACMGSPATGGPTWYKAGEVLPWDGYPELQELNGRTSGGP